MKTYTSPQTALGLSVICNLIGHKFRITKKITNHFHEYQCRCCGKQMTEDIYGRLIELTAERKEINSTLHFIFNKKQLQIE
ncbi:MAG: hypothetical protein ACOVQR_01255 [Flavobacterium sp.]|jgi:hypothetical protein|uniref:hypothetical protein n=1 Tax=Flavobacterium sp. TaxID=239 RepID=UPI003BA6149B